MAESGASISARGRLAKAASSVLGVAERYPFGSPWVRGWVAKWFPPLWFGIFSLGHLPTVWFAPGIGADVRLYQLAGRLWLAGANPWQAEVPTSVGFARIGFAGPPPTLIPFALVAWIPTDVLVLVVVLGLGATAYWVVRRLGLPAYWLLFPPIFDGIWAGNMNVAVIALLMLGGAAAVSVATIFKLYAIVPGVIAGRYRQTLVVMLVLAATLPFLPWHEFYGQLDVVTRTLATQSWGGKTNFLTNPVILIAAGAALVSLGRERASWLAVPVLFPSTQLHYYVLAMPVFAVVPGLALAAAIPEPGVLGAAVIIYAAWERRGSVLAFAAKDRNPPPRGRGYLETDVSSNEPPG